jgi:hypothetical protein
MGGVVRPGFPGDSGKTVGTRLKDGNIGSSNVGGGPEGEKDKEDVGGMHFLVLK